MHICLNRATAGRSLSFEEFVELAAAAGFQGADVELGWARTHGTAALEDLFESRRLRYGGWGVPFDWRTDSTTGIDHGLKDLEQFAAIAGGLKIDSCATWLLPGSDRGLLDNWHFHVQRLRPVARVLAGHNLRLGLEFVAPYHLRRQWKHEFLFTPGQVLELAGAVGPNAGLLVDSFHCRCSGTPWEEISTIPPEKIVLVHLNDAPALPRHQLLDHERLLPGEGALDLPAFLRALASAGYNGAVSLEVFSKELNGMNPADAARRAWSAAASCLQGVNRA
jgi:sugar phosphate isomerase/epimerase